MVHRKAAKPENNVKAYLVCLVCSYPLGESKLSDVPLLVVHSSSLPLLSVSLARSPSLCFPFRLVVFS